MAALSKGDQLWGSSPISQSIKSVSIVIPALNEEDGIGGVIEGIPSKQLESLGFDVQIIVVDNGSTDNTAQIARDAGADVVYQPTRGYGNAYKCGFASAKGDIIATADADQTYPVEMIPALVKMLEEEKLDFITTNRFANMSSGAMSKRNKIGNTILNITCRLLYGISLIDSQSGMWVFRKPMLERMLLRSGQMPFSEELKIESIYYNKALWKEIPIDYKDRVGEIKLRGWKDGFHNFIYMIKKRIVR
jgi:glycosyltransferase involved in cell wall biosynthesis